MKPTFKTACLVALLATCLAGCNTNGISTFHNNNLSLDREELQQQNYANSTERAYAAKNKTALNFLELGQQNFSQQNYGLAEKNFRLAVEKRSDDATAWLGLAASYDQLGRFDFADRAYEQLAEMKKNNARVLNNMGYSQLLRGNYSQARKLLNRAQSLDPNLEEVQGNIHLLEKTINS